MADAAMTTISAFSVPVTGPRSVIRIQFTPVAPLTPSRTLVTIVSGTSLTRPVRSARRSGMSAAGLATTGQPKPLQNPQSLQTSWSL
jgi:hypothetical protein